MIGCLYGVVYFPLRSFLLAFTFFFQGSCDDKGRSERSGPNCSTSSLPRAVPVGDNSEDSLHAACCAILSFEILNLIISPIFLHTRQYHRFQGVKHFPLEEEAFIIFLNINLNVVVFVCVFV